MSKLSQAIERIKPSPTLRLTAKVGELRASGVDVIGLSAGEPDFDTPDHIKQAAKDALDRGETNYTPADGTMLLKQAIIEKFRRDNGLDYAANQITVNSGGKHTIFNAMAVSVDHGDEVIIPAPYWVSYPDIVYYCGGTPVILPTSAAGEYKITPEQLERAITPKTRWLILNSPSNPSGAAYSEGELRALAEILLRHEHVMILSDDMYEHIWYADYAFTTLAAVCPALYDRVLTMNGVSKAYSMTGWRIGYAGGPKWLIDAMRKLQSQSTSNPSSISQAAAVTALNGPQDFLVERNAAFRSRRDYVVERLNNISGIICPNPQGAFYLYPDIGDLIGRKSPAGTVMEDDSALCNYWLDEAEVAAVPGSAFGLSPAFRLSYATSMEALRAACDRIEEASALLR